ncbi:MAG TPA: carbonic anhydrase, partial [Xanthomonadaceae bacterium]|nr:carbonic anhydrase [Xanthomonadaceae bacterium]
DNWLRHIGDVANKHEARLAGLEDPQRRHARLCELNVIEQVLNVCQSTVVEDAWARGQPLTVHGWIYGLDDGLVRELGIGVTGHGRLQEAYEAALGTVTDNGGLP